MNKTLRLFFAVPVPANLRKKYAALNRELAKHGGKVKWVEEENFHMTLKFLGGTPPEKVEKIIDAAKKTLQGHTPIHVNMKGLGAFPDTIRPRVYWTGLSKGAEEIARVAKAIDKAMRKLGYKKEKRKFSAHMTLGRVKGRAGFEKLSAQVEKMQDYEGGDFTLNEVHLIKSETTQKGPIYTVLERFELKEE